MEIFSEIKSELGPVLEKFNPSLLSQKNKRHLKIFLKTISDSDDKVLISLDTTELKSLLELYFNYLIEYKASNFKCYLNEH